MLSETVRAKVPEGWSDPDPVNALEALLILGGIPLLLFVGIFVLTYLPAMIRGERLKPGAPEIENQWLGGPRRTAGELPSPDASQTSETADAGGASGRW